MPSLIRRSANSDTMMASSTSMPTARISAEQDDDVHRQPEEVQAENAGQERDRDRNADEDRGAPAEDEQDDDEDEKDTGEHAVLQIGEKLTDRLRLVVDEGDLELLRPARFCRLATAALTPSTVAMRLAPARLETSIATAGRPSTRVIEVASLKVGLIVGDVAERDRCGVRRGDRDLEHVLGRLDQGRNLDGEPALRPLQRAGRNQAVALRRDLRRTGRATPRGSSGASARR